MKYVSSLSVFALSALLFISCAKKETGETGATATVQTDSTFANTKKSFEEVYAAFSSGKFEELDKHMAADFVDHNAEPGQKPGLAGLKEMFAEFRKGFPDMKFEMLSFTGSGDEYAARFRFTGTNSAEHMGIPPTGKKVDVMGIDWIRVKDGKAVEHWGHMDMRKFMSDMGMGQGAPEAPKDKGGKK